MATVTLSEFADKMDEIMPVIMREFLRHQMSEFYKTRLTMPQFVVMTILERNGESKMTDLARFINVTTAATTGLIDRIVRDGYAQRAHDPKDRRIIKVTLTALGEKTVKAMLEKRRQMTMKIFGMVSQKEREEYLKILMHVRDNLKEKQA